MKENQKLSPRGIFPRGQLSRGFFPGAGREFPGGFFSGRFFPYNEFLESTRQGKKLKFTTKNIS